MKSFLTNLFVIQKARYVLIISLIAPFAIAQMPDTGERRLILGPQFSIPYKEKIWQQYTSSKFLNRELPLFEHLELPSLIGFAQTDIHLEKASAKAFRHTEAQNVEELSKRKCDEMNELVKSNDKKASIQYKEIGKKQGVCHISTVVAGKVPLYQEQYLYIMPSLNKARSDRYFTYTITFTYPTKIDGKDTDKQAMKREIASFIQKVDEQNLK